MVEAEGNLGYLLGGELFDEHGNSLLLGGDGAKSAEFPRAPGVDLPWIGDHRRVVVWRFHLLDVHSWELLILLRRVHLWLSLEAELELIVVAPDIQLWLLVVLDDSQRVVLAARNALHFPTLAADFVEILDLYRLWDHLLGTIPKSSLHSLAPPKHLSILLAHRQSVVRSTGNSGDGLTF